MREGEVENSRFFSAGKHRVALDQQGLARCFLNRQKSGGQIGRGGGVVVRADVVRGGGQAGQTFPSSFGSTRGATAFAVDPTHAGVIYATAYQKGVWRSNDNGATWSNIHVGFGSSADRSEFALATTPDGHTRMYQTEGDSGTPYSRLFVAEAVESGAPAFVDKTSSNPADPAAVVDASTPSPPGAQSAYGTPPTGRP